MRRTWWGSCRLAALCVFASRAAGQAAAYVPFIEPASDEAAACLSEIRAAPGLAVALWAAEPLLANPVCLAIDDGGAIFVGESFRVHAGVTDIREHMDWLDDDLACESVADRLAMYARWLGADLPSYAREHDRVRRLADEDGDDVADSASVFADGFSRAEDGIGAGLLPLRAANGGTEVFYTNIPDLWRLRDADGDGRAEVRESLSSGWGVRVAFMGHDMHGLRIGPDGRLYWTIGDRGFSVRTADGRLLHHPDTGAVLRCELDGSDLTVVHIGLRNPQELAFDDRGDLFTGDNNCDAGDQARLVPIVQGGDSGWRQPGQWLSDRGPWGREKLWAPRFDGQAAWIIPPIANLASGPSGLTHEPGTAFPAFRDQFLLCDFTGGADSSHVWAFPLLADGAFYALGDVSDLLSGVLCTDADFGPDGALYVSDWVEGWSGTGKGRIWRVSDPAQRDDPLALRTRELLGAGMHGREVGALETLLGHPDQRVRQAAQFELVTRDVPGLAALERAARHGEGLARLHGIWGLGVAGRTLRQVGRSSPDGAAYARLAGLDQDADAEVRAQVFAVLEPVTHGHLPSWATDAVQRGLADAEPRVVARAALAAARLGGAAPFDAAGCVDALWAAARRADPQDPVLRHALATGLAACATSAELAALAHDAVRGAAPGAAPGAAHDPAGDRTAASGAAQSRALRLLAVLALRHQAQPDLALFLDDTELAVAAEAARAIHDLPVPAALPALAARIASLPEPGEDAGLPAAREGGPTAHDDTDALVRRVLNANDRLGGPEQARALAGFAARTDAREEHRVLALAMLAQWPQSPGRDRVHGFHLPVLDRAEAPLADLARELRAAGVADAEAPLDLTREWVRLCATAGAAGRAPDLAPPLAALLDDGTRDLDLRVEALHALAELQPGDLPAIVDRTLSATDARLRAEALVALEALSPEQALPRLPALLETGELEERRVAYQLLGRAESAAGETAVDPSALLGAQLQRALAGLHPAELQLDLVLACEARHDGTLDDQLELLRAPRAADPDLAPFADALFGGDAEAGRQVFESVSLSCAKCHARDEWGSQAVGPNLQGVGTRLARLQLVESIVAPNRRTAPGFGAELLFLRGGETLSGRVTSERDGQLCVRQHDGAQRWVPAADIEERRPGVSAMPDGLGTAITRQDMRDLVEYLAGL